MKQMFNSLSKFIVWIKVGKLYETLINSFQSSKSLTKEYKFETFKQAFVFMNTVSHMVDQMSRNFLFFYIDYPKWINVYNKLNVEITT